MQLIFFAFCGLAACLIAGCSKNAATACYPVEGTVVYQGKPLAEAMVVFHPLANPASAKVVAFTDSAGKFQLATRQSGDGVPAGKYGITVELRAPQMIGEETTRSGRNLLPARYAKPETSGLEFTVESTRNIVPALQIPDR
jgi:hypothetical protein